MGARMRPARQRHRIRWVALAALLTLAAAAVAWYRTRPVQADLQPINRQNVLLITIDTLRADALSVYGGPAMTPAIDRLASDGVRFDFAHAQSVLTLPSHASILTGQYPFQHGLRDNSGYRLPGDARTAASLFKQAGYATGAFVGAFPLQSQFGLNAGFDVYDDHFGTTNSPEDFHMSERPASAVVPLARRWISGQTQPWFAWVHVFDPHAPYQPPAPFATQYAGRPYFGEVAATDAALGPLLDDVRRSGRPTIVVVTGDHGEGLGEHGEDAHGIFAYESTLRIPLIIAEVGAGASVSAKAHAGELSSVAVRHVDILPTLLDATGQAVPADLPGRTLLPRAERAPGAPPRIMYFEAMAGMLNHGWAPLSGVLVGREKYIDLPIVERYELASDATETANLAGRAPDKDRALASTLTGFSPTRPGQRLAVDADAAARLGSLGYAVGQAPEKPKYSEADDPKRLIAIDQAIHRALDAFMDGRVVEAEDLYRQVIDRRPDMAIAYRHLAYIEWQAGNANAAIAVLRRGLTQGVSDRRAVEQLGGYLTEVGRLEEGLRILEPLAHDSSVDTGTLNVLGIGYARAGRVGDARRVFERLQALMPGRSAPFENLGVLALSTGDLRGARQYFDRAVAAEPDSSRAHAGVAAAAFQSGDRVSAFAEWTRAVSLDAMNFDALFSLGVNLYRDGQRTAARAYLEQFARTAPAALYASQRQEVARLLGR